MAIATTELGSTSELQTNESMEFNTRALRQQHDKLVAWASNQYKAIRNARSSTERQWYLNMSFYFGKQWVQFLNPQSRGTGTSARLWTPPAPYYRSRPIINRIRPTIRTELSQLTSNKPNATVVPASAEDRDMYAAMAAEQIWQSLYDTKRTKRHIRRAMWWTLVTGNGFTKTTWNSKTEDIDIISETPFHILVPDLRAEDIEDQPFVMHASAVSPEYIEMHWKKALDGEEIKPSSSDAQDLLEESFLNLIGTQALNRQQSVLMLEVWIKPDCHPMFPKGAFFTMIGNKIVQGWGQWVAPHKEYPFAKFDHIPSGKFYNTSSIEDLIPLQKEYNRTRGQIIEAKNRMAKPQLTAPKGSIDASQITTEPGQIIFYLPGFGEPKPLPLQALPNYVLQELDRIITDWNDISGQHEVTHGNVPPGVTAATAIAYLQERDEAKLTPTFDSLEEGIEKTAKIALSLVHENWDEERTVKVTGLDGSFDAMTFKGSDIANGLDIRIEGGSSLPQSKAAKQAFIMDLMKMQFIDPNKGLEVMDMGGINKLYEKVQTDKRQAQRENLRMSRITADLLDEYNQNNMMLLEQDPSMFEGADPPLIVPVNKWDNHQVHVEVHNDFRKGQTFEALPPEAKALFEAHVNMHIMALGVETETLSPRLAAGLPGLPVGSEGEAGELPEEEQQPGPVPMPEGV